MGRAVSKILGVMREELVGEFIPCFLEGEGAILRKACNIFREQFCALAKFLKQNFET